MVHKFSCYSDLEAYHRSQEQHVGYLEMQNMILAELAELVSKKSDDLKILEFGAGTGILSEKLLSQKGVLVDLLEPDARSLEILKASSTAMLANEVIEQGIASLDRLDHYDVIVSSFAHDHIEDGEALARSLFHNLTESGCYLCGVELLGEFVTEEERIEALESWHGYVIDHARAMGNTELMESEREALLSGVEKIADFKTFPKVYERQLTEAGFSSEIKRKVAPEESSKLEGVYFYKWSCK